MWTLPCQCQRKQTERFCECVTRKSNWIMLLLWISAAALAPADLNQNVLSAIQASESRQKQMKVITLWRACKGAGMKKPPWSMCVLTANTKTSLLAWLFFFILKTTYVLWPGRTGAALTGLIVFLCPFAEPGVQRYRTLHVSLWLLATRIQCAKTSSTQMYLW